MDLQLGLSLPSNPIKDLDLNKYENDTTDEATLMTYSHSCCFGKNKPQKRSFYDVLTMVNPVAQTLPLLSWNDKPNEEDDGDGDRNSLQKTSPSTIHDNGEGDGIVGWPPIKRSRRNLHLLHHHHQNQAGQVHGRPNSMYVKVKMEGVPIGRKVDLSLHNSYQTLTNTLISMFGKYEGDMNRSLNQGSTRYTLAYQDKDGDWLLVGDTPWQTFVSSVQRLEILMRRTGG
ncbi:auxin-responsive protein IAA28-like isoform X2 [Macadamia integrifolia]|uniref:auxin-responsive protein IAA28-like isoform X2 n=1 Tax=Macadamia integrifolia TaxID=60698 RepID=UPI001C4EDBAD|nr:auxin-responsive protein IAA28-like isoform X2 [Macadamia integrifolia]